MILIYQVNQPQNQQEHPPRYVKAGNLNMTDLELTDVAAVTATALDDNEVQPMTRDTIEDHTIKPAPVYSLVSIINFGQLYGNKKLNKITKYMYM